jgi:uncharacterized protein (DUF2235 family)
MKRLAIFLDGTANDPDDNTNVWRLKSILAETDTHQNSQLAYYDKGVGTNWYDRFRGGAAGVGLSKNVRQAYQWLIDHYTDGDAIYIFGFSRGAFTARSLAGMISKCGLLTPDSPMPVAQAYDRYENQDARPIYRLPRTLGDPSNLGPEDILIAQTSRRVKIKFIGVWDTVGALGVKVKRSRHEKRGEYDYHFVRLSRSYEHAYQALAIDEHRKDYVPSLWYHFIPEQAPDKTHTPPPVVEQRWFVGAHSNVGGGYDNDPLPQFPLQWIQQKAIDADLGFRESIQPSENAHLAKPVDSYARFLGGIYRVLKFGKRFYRTIGVGREQVTIGWIEPHLETIDKSVFEKWRADDKYRPKNLASWAVKANIDPATIHGSYKA